MLKIFLDNHWEEYNYDYLYENYGYTDSVSMDIVLYNEYFQKLSAWDNNHKVWVQEDSHWYLYSELPYYKLTSLSINLYRIEDFTTFPVYSKQGSDYIYFNNSFTTSSTLHNTFGYTETPSTVWAMSEGVPWSWYNSALNQYWDDRTGKKCWSINPPDILNI